MKNAASLFKVFSILEKSSAKAFAKNSTHIIVTQKIKDRGPLTKTLNFGFLNEIADLQSDTAQIDLKLKDGHFCFLNLPSPTKSLHRELSENTYTNAREKFGNFIVNLKKQSVHSFNIHFSKIDDEALLGALVGLEMAAYGYFKKTEAILQCHISLNGKAIPTALIQKAKAIGQSVNLARHLVNLPPNLLTPETYSVATKAHFSGTKIHVEIWDEKRLTKENLNLLLAVGKGSSTPARLMKLSYRPKTKSKTAKYAFVGKGITFDSGGLDLKPSKFMRLMKKDMGGSASVMGLAHYVSKSQIKDSIDFYIALAENSVGSRSFRPGDIYESRKGFSVEIDNTDAEGRLALADAITVALDESAPEYLIDLATLTGAGKVALGSEIASLFVNNSELSKRLMASSFERGDWAWPLPLFEKYNSLFPSNFADFQNSAVSGYGGAITAALFLKKFVDVPNKTTKWAHLDIYGWKDGCEGPFEGAGGNGQSVQSLIHFLES